MDIDFILMMLILIFHNDSLKFTVPQEMAYIIPIFLVDVLCTDI